MTEEEIRNGYFFLLGREPSAKDIETWTQLGLSVTDFRTRLLNSEEYLRFSTRRIVASSARRRLSSAGKTSAMQREGLDFTAYLSSLSASLASRAQGFEAIFENLLKASQKPYLIVETGTIRTIDNFKGDGMSTFLFDGFANQFGGEVWTCDISPIGSGLVSSFCSERVIPVTSDSVLFLESFKRLSKRKINLLYLDSLDLDGPEQDQASTHAAMEYEAIKSCLAKKSIVAVDDAVSPEGDLREGKAKDVVKLLERDGFQCIFDSKHTVWVRGMS